MTLALLFKKTKKVHFRIFSLTDRSLYRVHVNPRELDVPHPPAAKVEN